MSTTTPETLYLEAAVADRLGLTREYVRHYRAQNLAEKKDWCLVGRAVALTETGAQALLAHLPAAAGAAVDLSGCEVPAGEKKNGAAAPVAAATLDLKVFKILPNPRFLLAIDAAGTRLQVAVKSSENFRPGMTLRAKKDSRGHFTLEGRTPRYPGRY